jgi:UDP:flavonoid glycosyltransferase YjiC (YdhE family)
MRVLASCSLGGAGHLRPLLPFLAAARRRGDQTLVVGPPAMAHAVEAAGYAFYAGGEPPDEEVARIRERLPVAPPAQASRLANRDLFGRMATAAMLPGMVRVWRKWAPELVLREPCEYASAVVAQRHGTAIAQVAISLAQAEAGSITMAAPALEDHLAGLVATLRDSPYLTRFPASLDPSEFTSTLRYREPTVRRSTPLPDWWDGRDAPLLYMTFGTVLGYMAIATEVYRAALRAVEHVDVRVLLTVGERFDLSTLGVVPAHVHVEKWVEQSRVLDRADLVVCHGGSGTVIGALAAGVPLVVVPVFADQFENGRRIAASGAGRVVEIQSAGAHRSRRPLTIDDAPMISEQIDAVLNDDSHRRQARSIAAEIAATPDVEEVLARVRAG